MNPKVSVIVLNYNGLHYLQDTLPQLLKINYSNMELIVVDNGSTDGSLNYLQSIKEVRVLISPREREKNYACNYAVKNCSGEYILLLDNDALIQNLEILQDLVSMYEDHNQDIIIGPAYFDDGETSTRTYGRFYSKILYTLEAPKVDLERVKVFNGCNIGFTTGLAIFTKKDVWLKLGGFNENLEFGGDESDIGARAWMNEIPVKLYSLSLIDHLGRKDRNANTKMYNWKFPRILYANLYTITKNLQFKNILVIAPIFAILTFLSAVKNCFKRKTFGPFVGYFKGYLEYFKNIKKILSVRKDVQGSRVVKEDIFFDIKVPRSY